MWDVVEKENPLNQAQLFANHPEFYMVLTHAISGDATYIKASKDNILDGLRASSSIPVLTRQAVEVLVNPTLMAESQMLSPYFGRRNKLMYLNSWY